MGMLNNFDEHRITNRETTNIVDYINFKLYNQKYPILTDAIETKPVRKRRDCDINIGFDAHFGNPKMTASFTMQLTFIIWDSLRYLSENVLSLYHCITISYTYCSSFMYC